MAVPDLHPGFGQPVAGMALQEKQQYRRRPGPRLGGSSHHRHQRILRGSHPRPPTRRPQHCRRHRDELFNARRGIRAPGLSMAAQWNQSSQRWRSERRDDGQSGDLERAGRPRGALHGGGQQRGWHRHEFRRAPECRHEPHDHQPARFSKRHRRQHRELHGRGTGDAFVDLPMAPERHQSRQWQQCQRRHHGGVEAHRCPDGPGWSLLRSHHQYGGQHTQR